MRRRRQMRSAVPRQGAELAKYFVVVLIATFVQAAQSKPLLGHLPSHSAKKAADLTKVVPVFPTATDYASGVCAGYAFCFANWNPPVFTEPDVLCPSGYEVTQQYGKPFCVQKLGLCPSGYDLSSSGQCCTVKTQSQCYANWDECSAAGGSFSGDDVGSICKGSPEYTTLVNQIDMVEVTTRSIISDSPASQTQRSTTLPSISSPTLSGKGVGTHTITGDGGGSSIVLNDDMSSNIPSSIGGSMGSSVVGSNGQGLDAMPGNGAGGNGQVVNGISSNTIIGNGQLPDSVAGYGGSSMGTGGPQNVGVQVGVPGVGTGNGNTIPTVVPGNGNAALPPGSIVVDDNNGVINPNLPIISVEEPAAAVAPPPIIINIDSNGAAHVNGGAAGNQVLINRGAGRGFGRAGNGLPMQGGNAGGQVGSGMSNGITNPAVIPAGSLVNLNGRLVRIGGASAAAGSRGSFDGQAAGFTDQIQPGMVQAPVGAVDAMMDDVQTIPSGSFVDLGGGRVVQVGPKATGRSQMQAGVGAINRPASPQQQQALLDLQQQADASGTFAWMPRSGPAAATPTAPPATAGAAPATVPVGAGNTGLVVDDSISQHGGQLGESEWEEPAEDQQEVGRVLMPEAVPIFEGLRYESNSYEASEASHPAGIVKKAAKKAAGSSAAKQQQQWPRKKIQPQHASGTQTNNQHQYHAQRKLQQSNMRLAGAASRGSGAEAAGDVSIASYTGSSSSGSSSNSRSGSSVGVAMLPPPHPAAGVVLMKMLLLLPKLEIAKLSLMSKAGKLALAKMGATQVGKLAAQELLATKEVLASFNTHKEDLLPKCFNKCCTQDADVICTPAKQTINYARPQLTCPSGCELNTALGKCVCRPGSFSPCLPTDTVCSWGDQPICVGSAEFFGVPACTFVGALQKHLPRVQCPY